jgi:hypothetical protein
LNNFGFTFVQTYQLRNKIYSTFNCLKENDFFDELLTQINSLDKKNNNKNNTNEIVEVILFDFHYAASERTEFLN